MLVAMVWTSTSAQATIGDRYRVTNPYDFVNWDCGYPMRVIGVESDQVLVRTDKNLDGNVFVTNNYEFHETWTASDGRWFSVAANALAKDVEAKPLGGTLYEFTFHESGQPYTITDSSGAVVYRDRGNLSFHYTIDLADGTFNFLGVRVSGPHPVFDAGACKAVAPLTGTDSARYLTPRPIGSTTFPMGYYEYLPPSYSNSGAGSPLLVALNGYGENGDGTPAGLHNLLNAGIPRFIDVGGWPTARPLVVLALQHVDLGFDTTPCDGVAWPGSCNMQLQHDRNNASPAFCTTPDEVHNFITYALAHYNVDPKRVYITGLSCGAFGGWEYLAKYGDEHVAAAVLIAGDGRPAWTTAGCGLGSVPLWAFHGELDDVVNPQGSIEPMTNLAACPGVPADQARLTIYPGLFHDGWDQAYSGSLGDDIYTWMLAFSRP
jgi:dienelactone hydrolase